MKSKLVGRFGPFFGVLLFALALWVLHHELSTYHSHDILRHLHELPARQVFLALSLTIISYLIMTGYDALALRYVQHPLSYRKTALASFIAYAFSNNMGFGMLAGGSVRYRLYSAWGLSTLEVTKVVAFCSLTLWLGFLTLGGVVFLVEPLRIPETLHLPFASLHFVGVLFLAVVGSYFLLGILRKKPFEIHHWKFNLPSAGLSLAQTALALLDWAIAGSVLYALFPVSFKLSYPGFLCIYLLAQVVGMASQVPGGLGVFETVVVLLLSPGVPASASLGSLIAYRGIYYILPLVVAAALLGVQEVLKNKQMLQRFSRIFGRWISFLVPEILAFTTLVSGTILLLSGVTPAVKWRLAWLKTFLLLPVEVIAQADIPSVLPEFKGISDTWLAEKNTREKGLSLGFFSEDYLRGFPPAGAIRKDGNVVAFTNIWPGRGKEELSIDLMRYLPEAPRGAMDYLFIRLMLRGRQEGYRWCNLGMAPCPDSKIMRLPRCGSGSKHLCSVTESIFTAFKVSDSTKKSRIRTGSPDISFLRPVSCSPVSSLTLLRLFQAA